MVEISKLTRTISLLLSRLAARIRPGAVVVACGVALIVATFIASPDSYKPENGWMLLSGILCIFVGRMLLEKEEEIKEFLDRLGVLKRRLILLLPFFLFTLGIGLYMVIHYFPGQPPEPMSFLYLVGLGMAIAGLLGSIMTGLFLAVKDF